MRRALVLALALATACSGDPIDERPERIECEVRFAAPAGFEPLRPFEVNYPDHVGLRLGFRDGDRREFHVFAGIPGEFGEGLAARGPLELTEDRSGFLVGQERVWVVTWREDDVCDPRAVLGNRLSHKEFLGLLVQAGLAPGG